MILAGDVGGTKVHLALYNFDHGTLVRLRDEKFPAAQYACLDDVVNAFLGRGPERKDEIAASCFGCPGRWTRAICSGRLELSTSS